MSSSQEFDVPTILRSLASTRKVFHSEADFQFAFAWESKRLHPRFDVRLENHPEPSVRLDLQLTDSSTGTGIAIELKYISRRWTGTDRGEHFALKNHGAQDLRSYDVVKDVERVERFVGARPGWTGNVIALTNESSYWRSPNHGRATNADAFRLYEGTVLQGEQNWGPKTGGTARGRESPLKLRAQYACAWMDYSRIDDSTAGAFRALILPIGRTNGAYPGWPHPVAKSIGHT